MLDLVIRGGQVVTPQGVGRLGRRRSRASASPPSPRPARCRATSAASIDATGKLVIPGGIDPHVHTHWPIPALGGGAHDERAARAGQPRRHLRRHDHARRLRGVGAGPDASPRPSTTRRRSGARATRTTALHVMLQGAVPPDVIEQIPEAIQAGFPSIKIFTTDVRPIGKGRMIRIGHLWAIMETAARHGGILAIHAEDDDLVMYMYERLEREGRTDIAQHAARPQRHVRGHLVPPRAAAGALRRGRRRLLRARERARRRRGHRRGARPRAAPIYGETLHHYASFTAEAYLRPDGVMYHTYPSLKHEEDRQRLWTRAHGRHAQHRRHRRAVHAARDQGAEPPRRRRHRRPRRRRDARADHLHRGRVQARDVARALRRGHLDQRARRSSASIRRKGAHRPGQRRRRRRLRSRPCGATLRSADLHGSDYSAWDGWEVHGWPEHGAAARQGRRRERQAPRPGRATAAACRASSPPRSRTGPRCETVVLTRWRPAPRGCRSGGGRVTPSARGGTSEAPAARWRARARRSR